MERGSVLVAGFVAGVTAVMAGAALASMDWERARSFSRRGDAERAEAVVARWPQTPRLVARRALEEYGTPDEIATGSLAWGRRGPWESVRVSRAAPEGAAPDAVLEESVARAVPPERCADLRRFARGASCAAGGARLSARSSGEERNFLALNLADEIARGRRTVEEARVFYDRTIDLSLSGKASPYLKGLLFATDRRPWFKRL